MTSMLRQDRHPLGPPTLEGLLDYAAATLDSGVLEKIDSTHLSVGSERKYLTIEPWLRKKWRAVELLCLDRGPVLSILDLGTGAGHFPLVCRYLGHYCLPIDMPGIAIYDDLCCWMSIEKIGHRIEAKQPLPNLGQKFDLVTAFMIGFNTKADGTLFDLEDWAYFLDDVRDHQLKPGGRLCLKMIAQRDRSGPKFADPELQQLFEQRGAWTVPAGRYAIFDPLL